MPDNGFLSRLIWISLAAMILVSFYQSLPDIFRQISGNQGQLENAEPRIVQARGNLAEDEKSTIALFENSRDSVVFITTRQRVMDAWTRNIFSVPSGTGSGFIWITAYHYQSPCDYGACEATAFADGRDYKALWAPARHCVLKGIGFQRPVLFPGSSHDPKSGKSIRYRQSLA